MSNIVMETKLSIKQNILGLVIGAIYPVLGVIVFLFALGYGASCPDVRPCNDALITIRPMTIVTVPFWPALLSGMALMFAIQQIAGFFGILNLNNEPMFMFENGLLSLISFILVVLLWACIGVGVQRLIRKIVAWFKGRKNKRNGE